MGVAVLVGARKGLFVLTSAETRRSAREGTPGAGRSWTAAPTWTRDPSARCGRRRLANAPLAAHALGPDGARRRGDAEPWRPLLTARPGGGQLRLRGGARGARGVAVPAGRPGRRSGRLPARLDRDRRDSRA